MHQQRGERRLLVHPASDLRVLDRREVRLDQSSELLRVSLAGDRQGPVPAVVGHVVQVRHDAEPQQHALEGLTHLETRGPDVASRLVGPSVGTEVQPDEPLDLVARRIDDAVEQRRVRVEPPRACFVGGELDLVPRELGTAVGDRPTGDPDQVAGSNVAQFDPSVVDQEGMFAGRFDRVTGTRRDAVDGPHADRPHVVDRFVPRVRGDGVDGVHTPVTHRHERLDRDVPTRPRQDPGPRGQTGLAEVVRFGQGVAGELLRDAHHALLIDHQAVGVAEHLFRVLVEVLDRLAFVLAVGVVVVHVDAHRPRPIEREHGGDVLETVRRHRLEQLTHRRRLQLEHPDGVAPRQQVEGLLVLERDLLDHEARIALGSDHRLGVGDHVEVAQPQEVHLQQAEIFDAVHFVLGDDRRIGRVLARLGFALDRHIVGDGVLGDHHGSGVDAVGPLQPLQTPRDVDHPLEIRIGVVHRPEIAGSLVAVGVLRVLLEAVLERCIAPHHHRRHRLGELVTDAVRVPEHASGVANGVAGLDRAERDDLRDVVAPVALGGVADHLVAVSRVEVHVDVGHRDTTRVEEPLEQQVVLDRVEIGDPQAVRHRASSSRSSSRPDPDAGIAGVLDQVPRDEEVRREPHVVDDLEFVAEPLDRIVGKLVAPTLLGAFPREVLEVRRVVEPVGDGEVRQQRLAELDLQVGTLGDPQRVVARRRHLAKQVPHLSGRLQVVLTSFELEALRVRQQRTGLHAQQRIVGLVILLMRVVAVVGGQQRRADLLRDLDQLRVGLALCLQAVVLQLDEQVVASEDVLQSSGLLDGALVVAVQQRLQHVPAEATSGGDQPLGVLLEQLPVHSGLVVVALHERQARQLDQVLVAGLVLGQQGEVVVELLAALGVATGVVDPSAPRGTLAAVIMGHVRLGADDRLDALLVALLVEVQRSVHVAVIGHPDGRHPVGDRLGHHLVQPRRPVEHRELGVDVEVGEGIGHGSRSRITRM